MDPFRADIVLAAAFVVASVIDWRRRDPLLAAVVFAVPTSLQALAEGSSRASPRTWC